MRFVALILLVAQTTGAGSSVGLLLIAGDFVPTALGPLAGLVVDRFDRRWLMVWLEWAQAAVVVGIALLSLPLGVLLLLVATHSIFSMVFQTAARSAVPHVVGDHDLETANSLLGAGTYGLEALGPVLTALLVPFVGIRGVLVIDAATFVIAGIALIGLPRMRETSGEEVTLWAGTVEGVRYLRGQPILRLAILGFFGVVAFAAMDDVALVFLAENSLKASTGGAALLYGGSGVGLFIGFLALVRWARKFSPVGSMVGGFAVMCVGNLFTAGAPSIAAAFATQTVRGLGVSFAEVGSNTLVQRGVPARLRGRVFAAMYTLVGLAAALAYAAGGPLLDLTSPRVVLAVAGGGGLLVTGVVWVLLARSKHRMDGYPSTDRSEE